ncbi:MAG TPA: hypothetical protein VIW27_04365 [Gammaproteobacteria bacterium]|jgi:hypothetical protein
MKQKLMLVFASALLAVSMATSANQANTETAAEAVPQQAPAAANNFFDPGYWTGAFSANVQQPAISSEITFNAAQPSAWMQWVDPRTHAGMHATFVNPASYMQFMRPDFYMEFMKPENMAAWMNPAAYQVMMNPQTMSYWMNPATYMHAVDPAMYQQTMNPANYMAYMNPAAYQQLFESVTCDSENGNQASTWFGIGC